MLTPIEKNLLDSIIVLSFNSISMDAKFVFYLINESDFIQIMMSEISSILYALPEKLELNDTFGNFNTT
jgi:hypothetical protein